MNKVVIKSNLINAINIVNPGHFLRKRVALFLNLFVQLLESVQLFRLIGKFYLFYFFENIRHEIHLDLLDFQELLVLVQDHMINLLV